MIDPGELVKRSKVSQTRAAVPTTLLLGGIVFGFAFGFLLQKGGVGTYHILIGQLLFQDWTVVKIMGTAIMVGMVGIFTLHHFAKVNLHIKPTKIGPNVFGGLLFGAGFALIGYCPGTVAAALGQGSWDAIFGMLGLVAGPMASPAKHMGRPVAMSEITKKTEEQAGAEAEVEVFRKNLGPFVVAAETTRMAMVFTDATEKHNPIIFANDSFLSLTGYEREEVLGKGFNFLLSHGADDEAMARIKSEFEGTTDSGAEVLYRRKDGSEFWAAVFISPVRDARGDIVQYFASFVDLTKHKEDEAKSKLLIDELNHRVKNTLSTVQSIVWQAMRTGTDPKVIQEAVESACLRFLDPMIC